jgi:hypothetical protein
MLMVPPPTSQRTGCRAVEAAEATNPGAVLATRAANTPGRPPEIEYPPVVTSAVVGMRTCIMGVSFPTSRGWIATNRGRPRRESKKETYQRARIGTRRSLPHPPIRLGYATPENTNALRGSVSLLELPSSVRHPSCPTLCTA